MGGTTHLVALAIAAATIVLAGQPIYANDTWIHLALGRAFAEHGPWLASDPFLFTAPGPPSPAGWLGSVGIWFGYLIGGFTGLRGAHALGVLAILALAWRAARRAGASPTAASAALVGFVALSTYRLVQLRPDLFTIAATLALYPLVIAPASGPGPRRIAASALLSAIWANVHAAFLLGPLLVLTAGAGVLVASFLPRRGIADEKSAEPARERRRAGRLAIAALSMTLASLVNPLGIRALLLYLEAGRSTAPLESIGDEWNPTNLLAWPIPFLPPTVAAWAICWLCIVGVACAAIFFLVERGKERYRHTGSIDPALLAVAAAGLIAAVQASRFLWLGLFALALIGTLLTRWATASARTGVAAALLFAIAAATAHFQVGDWPLVSRSMRAEGADFSVPFPSERFNAFAVWFLADSGVEGRIFNDYPMGGFMGFWLAPRLQMAWSGTMNVERASADANVAIAMRQPQREGEDFASLLDRSGIDLFLGLGFPIEPTPGRPIPCTVRHLEREPGWILVFRNLRSAIYLRRNDRNARNLTRITEYYERAGVPFDPERGFDVEKVIRKSTVWAFEHGVVPFDFEALIGSVRAGLREHRVDQEANRLAVIYAALGLYERALQIDRLIHREMPKDPISAWRILWNLVQLDRLDEAIRFAEEFEDRSPADQTANPRPWSTLIRQIRTAEAGARASLVAHLPALRPEQVDWLRQGIAIAPSRSARPAESR